MSQMLNSVSVAIGLPFSGRPIPPEFALTFGSQNYPLNTRRATYAIKGREVGEAREEIADRALQMEPSSYGSLTMTFPFLIMPADR